MADQKSLWVGYDVDTSGGSERVLGVNLRLSGLGGSIEALGQQTMVSSIPVVLASNQSAISVQPSDTPNTVPWLVSIHDGQTKAAVSDLYGTRALNVVVVDADGSIISSFGNTGTIIDGTNVAIRATVFDYVNANPLSVRLTDTNGDYVSAGGGTQYTEDVASVSDPIGTQLVARRRDSLSSETSADGDVTAINTTAKGELYVKHVDAIPVTDNSSTLSVDDGGSSLTIDNAALSVTGGGVEASALRVTIANDSTGLVSVDDNGASLTIDNTTLSVTGGGVESSALRVTIANDSTGVLSVDDNGASLTVDGSVTVTQSTASNLNAQVVGPDAHDAAVSGNPVTISGRASSSAPTAVSADGDVVRVWADRRGAVKVALVDDSGDSVMDGTNNAVNVNVVAGGAGNGSILDGVDTGIKASVLDYTNSNPLAVRLTDTNGDYVGAGAGTQYTEDAASVSDPVGTQLIARRRDTLTPETSADGDVTALNATSKGELYIKSADPVRAIIHDGNSQAMVSDLYGGGALNVAIVDGDGTQITSFGGGTQYTEDAASAANPVGNQLMARRRDSLAGETSADGDVVAANATDKGELYVKHVDSIPVTDNGGSLTIDNAALAVTGGGVESSALRVTIANDSTGLLSVDDNGGSLTVDNATLSVTGGGVESSALRVTIANDSTGVISVDDNGASLTIDGTVTANAGTGTFTTSDTATLVDDAAFTPATSRVLMVGATFDDSSPDSVNEGDGGAVRMSANRNLYSTIRDAAGNERGVNVNASNQLSVSVDNTVTVASHAVTNAGTFAVQATQSGTWTVQPGDTPNAVPWLVSIHDGQTKARISDLYGTTALNVALFDADGIQITSFPGAITDADNSNIKATVFDYANANPLSVRLTDTNGDYVSAGGGTQYTEDVASASDPVGTQLIARRRDSLSSETSADGDNTAINSTSKGELYVKHVDSIPVTDNGSTLSVDDGGSSLTIDNVALSVTGGGVEASALRVTIANDSTGVLSVDDNGSSLTVDNAGTFAVQATIAAGATNVAKAEDTASADADVGIPAMAVRKASPANTSGADGDYEMLQMSAGRLWASATIDAALPAGTNAIGKLAANSGVDIGDVDITTVVPGTGATNLGKAEDAAHADGDTGVMALAVRRNTASSTSGTDGDYQPLITNTTGHLWVDASGQTLTVASHAVTNAGTFAVQVDGSALTALQLIDNSSVDHDAAVVAGVTQQGAAARTSDITAVANGDAVRVVADTLGKQVVLVGAVHDLHLSGTANFTDSTAADIIAAQGLGVRIAVMSILVTNAHASVNTKVEIRDATTVKITGYAAAVGGGFSYAGTTPLFITTANQAVTARCATTGANVDVSISGYKIAN